ncbi:MAG: hypothetical protein QF442_00980 [Candidatus Peribacteraceae bacterium]|jgi:hypothetical protein|nr:hypothetical protein [Candidatus Peribacteraceae bacterium]
MNWHIKAVSALIIPCLFLTACEKEEVEELLVSGAKSAIAVIDRISSSSLKQNRPSASLGIYVGIYTAQRGILPVKTAMVGLNSVVDIIAAQNKSNTSENYALLIEVGEVLQVNVPDYLNRSNDRTKVMDEYIQSLKNTGILIERKINELEALEDEQSDEMKARRKTLRDTDKQISTALRNQDYGTAAEFEEQLAEANSAHAEIEVKKKLTSDMLKRLDVLLNVTIKRLQAVENNREILIAGLRVIKVPGISDLNILEEGKSWRKIGTDDVFGRGR